jgi:ArsR family transcriptional regulator, arsenate/arsenite/antimonite-responsive transcriptional repressor
MENPSPSPADQEAAVVKALAALAQPQRLRAFRALVVAGAQGLTPGAMAEQLGISPSTLSFHLKELLNACLINNEARGRNLIYRASFAHMTALLSYLTQHCCQGATDGTPEAIRCEGC